ncbi:unnamed protein product, partial [Medioppia subpectinata]
LQKESDFFMNFIEGHRTVSEFCKQEVEPMYKESDHIHIIALTQEFKVGVRIVYMDRGEAEKANTHDFGIDEGSAEPPKVYLLYRPVKYYALAFICSSSNSVFGTTAPFISSAPGGPALVTAGGAGIACGHCEWWQTDTDLSIKLSPTPITRLLRNASTHS